MTDETIMISNVILIVIWLLIASIQKYQNRPQFINPHYEVPMFWCLHCQILPPPKGTHPIDGQVWFHNNKVQKNRIAPLDNCHVFTSQKQAILGWKWHSNTKIRKWFYKTDLPVRERCWNGLKYMIDHFNWFFERLPLWTTMVILSTWLEFCDD